MTLDEYQKAALRTAARPADAYPRIVRLAAAALENAEHADAAAELLKLFDQMIWCLGAAGELGETLDMLKKHWGHGQPLDRERLKLEFGDQRYYGAVLEDSFGLRSSDVAAANNEKLHRRFPAGFTVAAAAAKADER